MVIDNLPVLCADKNYQGIDDVIWNGIDLVEMDFTPTYPDIRQWSNIHYVEISTVNPKNAPTADDSRTPTITMEQRTHGFDTNLQKQLLSKCKQSFKIKAQKFFKFVADKKALITIIFGQCNKAIKTEIALREDYDKDCQAGNSIEFLNQVRTVCLQSDNRGLSFGPYK